MARSVNLNELANMPGFGAAKAQLKKSGHWDEHAGAGPERTFTIEVEGTAPITGTITVKARSKAEAEEKAEAEIEGGNVDWDVDHMMANIKRMETGEQGDW